MVVYIIITNSKTYNTDIVFDFSLQKNTNNIFNARFTSYFKTKYIIIWRIITV